jgi:replicative DNA helicase
VSAVNETVMEAEQALLGLMMSSPSAVYVAMDALTADDFFDPRHHTLVEVLFSLLGDGKATDVVAVSDEVLRRKLEGIHSEYLFGLTSKIYGYADPAYLAAVVKRHSSLRLAAKAASTIQQGIAEGWDILDINDQARKLLDGVDDQRAELQPVGEQILAMLGDLERPPTYYPTRWRDVNGYLNGLMPGSVYVVAARPGAGKTIMGLQMAVDLCRHGRVIFFSLEMPRDQILRRLTASEGSVDLTKLMRHTLLKDDWLKVAEARRRINEMPLYIDDRSAVSIQQIEATARQLGRREQVSGIVVDYLQLIPQKDSRKARWEHVGELTRALKILAKDLNVPVIVLCQINRESEKNRRLPGLHDLRESGSIEQDADAVIMLQRRLDDDDQYGEELDVVIAKNRHGQSGRLELRWEGKYSRVIDMPIYGATPTIDYASKRAGED